MKYYITSILIGLVALLPVKGQASANNIQLVATEGTFTHMHNDQQFYQANAIQTEFLVLDNQTWLIFLPMPESLFHCPGIVTEKIQHDTVTIKFVRQSIHSNIITDDLQPGEYVSTWMKNNPENKILAQSKLAKSKFAQYVLLPGDIRTAIFYQDGNAIKQVIRP